MENVRKEITPPAQCVENQNDAICNSVSSATCVDNKSKTRSIGLDLIRSLAISFVIAGHFFFLNTDFLRLPFVGGLMVAQDMLMALFITGVPLFLMLTGYLNCKKVISKKYFRNGLRVIYAYLFFAVITILFRRYYMHQDMSVIKWILTITDFTAVPYAWYIEMWLGLFVFTPFLNKLWWALGSRSHKLLLLAVLAIFTALPNTLNFHTVSLVPDYWNKCTPVFYYYVGTWIREYQPKVSIWSLAGIIIAGCAVDPIVNLILWPGLTTSAFGYGQMNIITAVVAIALFLACYKVNFNVRPLNWIITRVSKVSLDMDLVAYIVDKVWYPWFKSMWGTDQSILFAHFPLIVTALVATAYILAEAKVGIFRLLRIPT